MNRLLSILLSIFVGLVFVFLLLPIVSVVISSFSSSAVLAFPPRGFTLRWYGEISADYISALKNSLVVASGTAVLACLIGTPTALAIVRGKLPGKEFFSAALLSPMMVSTLVIAVAAFQFSTLIWSVSGISLAGSIVGLILAQSAFTIPLVIRAVFAGHAHFDASLEEAANSLGATPLQTFIYITLPLLIPGIVSGTIFAFVMSFDDVAVALFMGGGSAMTLPVKIYTSIEYNFDTDIMAISSLVVLGSLILMLVLDRLGWSGHAAGNPGA